MKNSQGVKQHTGNTSAALLQIWRGALSTGELRRAWSLALVVCERARKHNRKTPQTLRGSRHKLPVVPQDDRHGRGRLASPVLVLLVLHLWLGPMPVLWASTSNSLMSYMLQPTGWSGHSSLPAILHTVQPRLIFNTEAKRVKGLKCEYVYVCGEEGFVLPNNSHFSSASIAAPISACWMLD